MSTDRVVAIVDAYSTARYFAPLFHARGYRCVHVRSAPSVPAVYAPTFHPDDFTGHVVHHGDVAATAGALARLRPTAVIAGIESGVELADQLSEALGLRTNGTALSETRRDKYRMGERIRQAGIPGAAQLLVSDRDELAAWYARSGGGRVVVKPVKSAGNDGVHFCDDEAGVLAAFDALIGTDSALDLRNNAVIAQEYLLGVEYYVNTVSLDGTHYVCDIHSTRHLAVNGVGDLLGGSHLLPRRGPVQDRLVEYVSQVLDALGIRNGPAHTELKLTEDGPRLIETASRICGADLPVLVDAAIGASQLAWTVDAYTDPTGFTERAKEDYRLLRHAVCVNMISPASGTLRGYPKMDQVSALPSFHGALTRVRPGDRVHRTVNDFTYPMLVHLLHPSEAVLLRDYATVRYLDGDGFYTIDG
jgi:biotin carboxylase